MNFQQYQQYFQDILHQASPNAPYDSPDYFNYTKLNWSRMNRWLKTGQLTSEIIKVVASIKSKQNWIVITEPWCGDAAHIVPFIDMIAQKNENISVQYELRDSEPNRIEHYLTNGKSKSIPKLIIQNEMAEDLAVWGPRPVACQVYFDQQKEKNLDFEALKTELQHWYNNDEGIEIMKELSILLPATIK
jgi:hypothetical protein